MSVAMAILFYKVYWKENSEVGALLIMPLLCSIFVDSIIMIGFIMSSCTCR